jgi:hypothetical protein
LPDIDVRGIESYHILHNTDAQLDADAQAFRSWIIAEAERTRREHDL